MPLEFTGNIFYFSWIEQISKQLLNTYSFFNRFAEAHNRIDLLGTALRFIEVNFPRVSLEEEFLDLPKELLVHFISSENIHIDTEFQVRPLKKKENLTHPQHA